MKFFDRILDWFSFSEDEKVAHDRRAFLRGMVVTSGGLLVAGTTVFDMGRRIVAPGPFNHPIQSAAATLRDPTGFLVGDYVTISGGTPSDGVYQVTGHSSDHLLLARAEFGGRWATGRG